MLHAVLALSAAFHALDIRPSPEHGAAGLLTVQSTRPNEGLPMPDDAAAPAGRDARTGLPMARGRTFETLDEYLAYLRSRSTIDAGWYKEVSPGVYRLMTMAPPGQGEDRLYTREELMAKFGFSQ